MPWLAPRQEQLDGATQQLCNLGLIWASVFPIGEKGSRTNQLLRIHSLRVYHFFKKSNQNNSFLKVPVLFNSAINACEPSLKAKARAWTTTYF